MKMKAKQYTIRNVPSAVDKALRKKAMEKRTSVNSFLLGVLEREAGVGAPPAEHHDLDFLVGSWVSDPETDRVLDEQRKLDRRDWE
ncbi:MAG: hypothetical protein HY074_04155 [Deltaproteobacteria bacterium]|nr:hypothetical protein [Deltaproteobacteria bacterium]